MAARTSAGGHGGAGRMPERGHSGADERGGAGRTAERGHGGADEHGRVRRSGLKQARQSADTAARTSAGEHGRARRSRPHGRARAWRRGRVLPSAGRTTERGTTAWTSSAGARGHGRTDGEGGRGPCGGARASGAGVGAAARPGSGERRRSTLHRNRWFLHSGVFVVSSDLERRRRFPLKKRFHQILFSFFIN
jgi:hypothetical protein